MDKSWITKPRNSLVYDQGVKTFIEFAFQHGAVNDMILCPCPTCGFSKRQKRAEVYDHLICKPYPKGYPIWHLHGESHPNETTNVEFSNNVASQSNIFVHDPIRDMVNDAFGVHDQSEEASPTLNEEGIHDNNATPNLNQHQSVADDFYDLSNDGQQPLYEGCANHSKLSFTLKLYHIKCLCGMSDKAMTMILELLNDAFPNIKIPRSFYDAKKTITKLGLNYEKIHACPNNCMLYWGNTEDEERQICKVCSTSRWKMKNDRSNDNSGNNRGRRKIPAKLVRYFPLKPRLQRSDTNVDGLLRHPRDCEAWKKFDLINSHFAADPRNVRLALATDGFNPYGSMNQSYSIWPIVLIPYNLPPWMCMKQASFIISTIIPGKQMPGNDIDVYLQPLIRELKELWCNGVNTYDSFKKEMFKMHAALLWTISDYPGLGNLSGWNVYTGRACVHCNYASDPCRLPYSRKWCFMGHRRFLATGHKFRLNKIRFNGEQELRNPPKILSGTEILQQVQDINITFGRLLDNQSAGKRRRGASTSRTEPQQWKKKSIFFELPYWEHNLIRHNLDVMHIEKNVCDNVLFTLLNDSSRSKDHVNACKDLKHMCCKPDLWPDDNGKFAAVVYTMNKQGKKLFLDTLKNICVPDGYASNISRCIDTTNLKIVGTLKSHDSHVLLQQFLPLAMREGLHDNVSAVLLELCSFFRQISGKVLSVTELDKFQDQIIVTLCHMEMLFPPSFFTLMIHLVVHLVDEAKLGSPVYYRWMYPIEMYLGILKSYVRNKARPEGSIAEDYIAQEVLTFCSRYFENIETIWNRPRRVDDEPAISQHPNARIAELFPYVGKEIGSSELLQRRQLRTRSRNPIEINRDHDKIQDYDKSLLLALVQGPINQAKRYSAYNVNGYKFRTLEREKGLKTQNSGVFGTFGTRS
ncbi:uncharacterized protein LOC120251851 [Dioscorea cayenensis subsp. rotundata]|uniref:Uncharacterized protein LOC120251851 n=1 Tax=Dioscorea cayennensis subsp. rotundata TaxID=55577 RepID=A0AB40AND5_DIOCR|nr:uncharacterized protein LOC120251851 [Dioscorea cayenensis subsp. rotundata]